MTILDAISNHLEFLGYTVTDLETQRRATHARRWDILFKEYKGGVLFTAYLSSNEYAKEQENRQAYLEFSNAMNEVASVARFYVDKDQDFAMEALWSGDYERIRFGEFMDLWDADTRTQFHQLDPGRFFQ